jgi:hypothetical protein
MLAILDAYQLFFIPAIVALIGAAIFEAMQ